MKIKNLWDKKITVHHNNAKWGEWSNDECNKTEIPRWLHRAWHILFGILPPHLCIKFMLKLWCECLEDHIKDEIIRILSPKDVKTLYKYKSIKNSDKFEEICYKGQRVDYRDFSYKNSKGIQEK